ncbi:MAG: histidine phosphatase family protein [Actinomycetota bacterium]|nr:histidine phosphatase family protein [Actinomycetota bacterium]
MTSQLIVARHAETKCLQSGMLNGNPAKPCPLTARGIQQAAAVGRRLETTGLDLCITTAFERTKRTASIALGNREVNRLVEPLLNDPVLGAFEGMHVEQHRKWLQQHSWDEAPVGGESQLEALSRFVTGWRRVLARREQVVLVFGHAFPICFALTLASGEEPAVRRHYEKEIEPAQLITIDVADLDKGLRRAQAELATVFT